MDRNKRRLVFVIVVVITMLVLPRIFRAFQYYQRATHNAHRATQLVETIEPVAVAKASETLALHYVTVKRESQTLKGIARYEGLGGAELRFDDMSIRLTSLTKTTLEDIIPLDPKQGIKSKDDQKKAIDKYLTNPRFKPVFEQMIADGFMHNLRCMNTLPLRFWQVVFMGTEEFELHKSYFIPKVFNLYNDLGTKSLETDALQALIHRGNAENPSESLGAIWPRRVSTAETGVMQYVLFINTSGMSGDEFLAAKQKALSIMTYHPEAMLKEDTETQFNAAIDALAKARGLTIETITIEETEKAKKALAEKQAKQAREAAAAEASKGAEATNGEKAADDSKDSEATRPIP